MARKVLVADDSVTIQKVVGLTFANEDIELSFVDNGEEAITVAKQLKPDLILADVLMPAKSGYEVCEIVKSDPELQHIPVLLLTGTFEPFDADRCARVGADGTITKPFESQTLIREVRELLERPASRAQARPPAATVAEPALVPVEPPAVAITSPQAPGGAVTQALALEADLAGVDAPAAGDPIDVEPIDVEPIDAELTDPASAPDPEATTAPEEDFSFAQDPETALQREDIEPPQAPSEGAPEAWSSPASDTLPSPSVDEAQGAGPSPEGVTPQGDAPTGQAGDDVWDLSDLEAVDEGQPGAPEENDAAGDPDALWNEAAAEAIDIVETTNLESDNEPAAETPPAEELPQPAPEIASSAALEGGATETDEIAGVAGFGLVAGESEFEALDLGSDRHGGPLEVDAPEQRPPDPAPVATEPPLVDIPPLEELPVDDLEESALEEVAVEPLPEFGSDELLAELPSAGTAPPERSAPAPGQEISALTGLPAEQSEAIVREAVKSAVEKVTWEAFSDLSETVTQAVQEKVEKIAWEVIPQIAETIIKDEIRRLKEGDE